MFWKNSGIKTFDDLVRKGEVTVGASGPTAVTATDAYLLNAIFGTKMKVILGFKGTAEGVLAAERGELDGHCGMWVSSVTSRYMDTIKNGTASVVVQLGSWRHPEFPKATHILEDLNPSAENRQAIKLVFAQLDMARPFVAPPGVPADRVAILRKGIRSDGQGPGIPGGGDAAAARGDSRFGRGDREADQGNLCRAQARRGAGEEDHGLLIDCSDQRILKNDFGKCS